MAKTYYKYAKRETTPVDYAAAAKGLSEGLMATVTGLEKKAEKAAGEVAAAKSKIEEEFAKEEERKRKEDEAIDKALGDKIGELSKLPISTELNYRSAQEAILDMASDTSNWKLQLKRDYDAGKMTTKEYNRKVNNIGDQFKLMKQSSITIMDMVKSVNEGVENGTSLPAEQVLLKELLNLKFDNPNMEFVIDNDGNMIGEVRDDSGNVVKRLSMYEMNKLSLNRFPTFDIDSEVATLVSAIGEEMETSRGAGMTTEQLLDKEIMKRGNEISTPNDYIAKTVNGFNSNKLASILQMKMDDSYDVSFNKAAFGDEKTVVYEINPASGMYEAKLTENQKKEARDFATASVLLQLNPFKKPDTTGKAPSSAQIAKGKRVDIDKERINDWLKFYTGDDATKERILSANSEAIAKSVGAGDRPIDINVVGNTISVSYEKEYEDGTIKTITKDITIPEDDFVGFLSTSGRKLLGDDFIEYLDEALEISDYTGTEKYKPLDVSHKTQVKVEESKKQSLGDFSTIMSSVLPMGSYWLDSTRDRNVVSRIGSYQSNSGIKGFDFSVEDGVVNMSIEGLGEIEPISIVGMDAVDIQPLIDKALIKVHEAATTGKPLEGTTEPAKPAGGSMSGF
jgi:hypothetical protein